MATWKKILIGIAIVLAAFIGVMIWYVARYSMYPVQELEVNSPGSAAKVLIATQGSAFKDSIVAGVLAHLEPRQVYAKVIDLSSLPSVREADWNAIVVIHTWEMEKPPAQAKAFLERVRDPRKVVVLSTSGAGISKMQGVDAISSASEMIDVPKRVTEINSRIDSILATPGP